jgi:uncharacterized protein (DUF952 family)
MSEHRTIYHFTERETCVLAKSTGEYKPLRFEKDGFIHCSTREQVLMVANNIAPRDIPLVLLEIDTARVPHNIIYENLEGGTMLFPHIYGGLPIDAVTEVYRFAAASDGRFEWPREIEPIA